MSDTNKGNGELKGSTLKVVRGKKVPQGTVGLCIWHGYGKKEAWGKRVGIKDSEGTVHWTAEKNCEVVSKGARQAQTELFSKPESKGNQETTVIWIERLSDGVAVVALDVSGNKLIHGHRFPVGDDQRAMKLADKVRESGKDWSALAASDHWINALDLEQDRAEHEAERQAA